MLQLDAKSFLKDFKKWGPCARTCVGLACGSITEEQLQEDATRAAKMFAQNPSAFTMETQSQDISHVLFTVSPNDVRSTYTLRVATPYLRGLVTEEIAKFDAADHVSFYHHTSSLPAFKGTLGYLFEKYFLAWLCSGKRGNVLSCVTKPLRSVRCKSKTSNVAADDQTKLRLQPLGRDRLIVSNGDSCFANAKDSNTPFGWVPASSRTFPSFDAVICTSRNIITIQVTVSSEHTMEPDGFDRLKRHLPARFQSSKSWCHVFITDCADNADSLRKQNHQVAKEMNISIYSAVLDVSACSIRSEDLRRAFRP